MKFQAVLVFFAGALALAAPIEEKRGLPVVGTAGTVLGLAGKAKGVTDKVAPSTGLQNLPAAGLVQGLPIAGGLLGGGGQVSNFPNVPG